MDAMRLESYSKALSQFPDDSDTLQVLDTLVKSPRAEYEAKIPELGNLLGLVRERRRGRLAAQEMASREREHAAYLMDMKEHPENYVSLADLLKEYQNRRTKETV